MRLNEWKCRTLMAPAVVLALALGLASAPSFAGKPSWAGGGKEEHAGAGDKQEKKKAGKEHAKSTKAGDGRHFRKQDEEVVRSYYRSEFRDGKDCPPGLAKKNNGCLPPGQAKKQWATGKPLAREVEYHDLPRDLLSKLPVPRDGQRYVRVLADILLIEPDSRVVTDAIVDIVIP